VKNKREENNKLNKSTPIGKLYVENLQKDHSNLDTLELSREFTKDYMHNLTETALKGKKLYPGRRKYYVVVLLKRERLMPGVLRNYFFTRLTCPSPSHDITVYSFDSETEELKFLWFIPSKKECIKIYNERYIKPTSMTPYVVDFMEGRLASRSRKLNKVEN